MYNCKSGYSCAFEDEQDWFLYSHMIFLSADIEFIAGAAYVNKAATLQTSVSSIPQRTTSIINRPRTNGEIELVPCVACM